MNEINDLRHLRNCDNPILARVFLANKLAFKPSYDAERAAWLNFCSGPPEEVDEWPEEVLQERQKKAFEDGIINDVRVDIIIGRLNPSHDQEPEALLEISAVVGGERKSICGMLMGFNAFVEPYPDTKRLVNSYVGMMHCKDDKYITDEQKEAVGKTHAELISQWEKHRTGVYGCARLLDDGSITSEELLQVAKNLDALVTAFDAKCNGRIVLVSSADEICDRTKCSKRESYPYPSFFDTEDADTFSRTFRDPNLSASDENIRIASEIVAWNCSGNFRGKDLFAIALRKGFWKNAVIQDGEIVNSIDREYTCVRNRFSYFTRLGLPEDCPRHHPI